MAKKTAIETQKDILSKIKGDGKVILKIEQEVWNEGEKLSNPHNITVQAKYIANEVLNLANLGYTVEFVSQEIKEIEKPGRKKKEVIEGPIEETK